MENAEPTEVAFCATAFANGSLALMIVLEAESATLELMSSPSINVVVALSSEFEPR